MGKLERFMTTLDDSIYDRIYNDFISLKFKSLTSVFKHYIIFSNDISEASIIKSLTTILYDKYSNIYQDRIDWINNNGMDCIICKKIKPLSEFHQNFNKNRYNNFKKCVSCKTCAYTIMYKNKKIKRKNTKFKDEIMYVKKRKKRDTGFKILSNLRSRLRLGLKNNIKSQRTLELIGCSIEQLKIHLQQTAINNGYADFTIDQYGYNKYDIDHIKPCSIFDMSDPEQQKECFHWTNLQILDSYTNRIIKKDVYEV